MAHDYQPASLDGFEGTAWQNNAALTPIDEIETAPAAITGKETGVADAGKIALAESYGITGASVWRLGIVPHVPEWDVWEQFIK